ncbi:MAG: ribonuclease HII [Nitrospiria bacterium]
MTSALVHQWEKLTGFEKTAFKAGCQLVAGIDEAGRGPLAGPVVAASVIFASDFKLPGLNDSKLLTAGQRETFYKEIIKNALAIGIGIVEPDVIDQINILQGTHLAAQIAVSNLPFAPDYLLIDALNLSFLKIPQKSIIKGDRLSYSIAGASVIAKVTRDRLMEAYHLQFPHYHFNRHKGYGTKEHLSRLRQFGPSPIHRRSFRGVIPSFS